MTLYAIYAKPEAPESEPAIVAERFSWTAFLFVPLFLLWHRLWLGLVLFVLAVIVLTLALPYIGAAALVWLYLVLALWMGFAAPSLIATGLRHRGFVHLGDIIASGPDLAEQQAYQTRLLVP